MNFNITHYPLPITHYSLLITHHPSSITHNPSLMKIEHLGIAVKSLSTSDDLFAKLLGKENYKQEAVEREGVTT